MTGNRISVGDAEIARVVEWVGPQAPVATLFPQTPQEVWREHSDELVPTFWDPDSGYCRLAVQTWVVRVDGLTVIVDTGVGNDRERPQNRTFHKLATDFPLALERAGVDRDAVDVVINTHIHLDHVGWNTFLDNGAWRPTFPNARYLVNAADHGFFHPDNAGARRAPRNEDEKARFEGMRIVWNDSIAPIADAGQLVMWSGDSEQVSPSLELFPAPGHTPGSSVLWLDSAAVFVGDLTHTPMQIHRPDDHCAFDVDPETASASRRRVVAQAATRGALLAPAHYPGHGATTLASSDTDNGFRPDDWAAFDSV
jgi:glyoxylase-like metal-dependent hydrolase (beta-lactamase superfamily II)